MRKTFDKIFYCYLKRAEIIIPVAFLIFMLMINVPNLMYEYGWELNNDSLFYWGFLVPLIAGLALIFVIRYVSIDYEKKVILTVLVLGCILAMVAPVNNGWDESSHFFKTVASIDGKGLNADDYDYRISDSFYLLKNSRNDALSVFDETFSGGWAKTTTMSDRLQDGTAQVTYPVWGYLFCMIGVWIAQHLSLSVGMIFLSGRLFNLFGFCLMGYWALKTTPLYKSSFAVFMMIPATLIVASSFSCDSVAYGLIMLLIAYFIKWKQQKRIRTREFIIWSVLMLLLTPLKYPYLLLLGLLLLLPEKEFAFKKGNCYILGLILTTITTSALWLGFVSSQFKEFRVDNFDTARQVAFMMHEPFKAIWIFIASINTEFPKYFHELFRVSYEYEVNVPGLTSVLFLFFAYYALCNSGRRLELSRFEKTWLTFMVICIWLVTDLALYLSFAPVAFLKPYGMQGRYLTPLLLLIAMIVPHKVKNRQNRILSLSITFAAVLIMTMSYYFYFG